MQEGLEKGVLNDLVHLRGIAQVVIGDPCRSALLPIDDSAEPFCRLLPVAAGKQTLDLGGECGLCGNPMVSLGSPRKPSMCHTCHSLFHLPSAILTHAHYNMGCGGSSWANGIESPLGEV